MTLFYCDKTSSGGPLLLKIDFVDIKKIFKVGDHEQCWNGGLRTFVDSEKEGGSGQWSLQD